MHLVRTDGFGRMDLNALAAAVAADRAAGRVPVMIAATAGTTGSGMIDPLDACGDIARKWGLWYHIDAAWGGALIASNRWRHVLAGIETAELDYNRCSQMVRHDDGLRDVHHDAGRNLIERISSLDKLHAV